MATKQAMPAKQAPKRLVTAQPDTEVKSPYKELSVGGLMSRLEGALSNLDYHLGYLQSDLQPILSQQFAMGEDEAKELGPQSPLAAQIYAAVTAVSAMSSRVQIIRDALDLA